MARPRDPRRYRKVYVRIWADETFNALSAAKPNAQTLWFYLLTGPHTNVIPGLFTAGEAAMAERLRWPLRDFRRCFAEIAEQQMARADWARHLVWLPKAVHYNVPENPNVAKSWRTAMAEIPECALQREAEAFLDEFLGSLSKGLQDAFRKGSPKGYGKGFEKGLGNQEQEQEQEQDPQTHTDTDRVIPATALRVHAPRVSPHSKPSNLINGAEQRGHGTHAWCSLSAGRGGLCVPASLHREFIDKLAASHDAVADLVAWYPTVVARYLGVNVGDDVFRFWRNEFAAWVGVKTSAPTRLPAALADHSTDWVDECARVCDSRCGSRYVHVLAMQGAREA